MIFHEDEETDRLHILASIDGFVEGLGLSDVYIQKTIVEKNLRDMRSNFPAQGGLGKASTFKKCSNFLCYFVANGPIISKFPKEKVGPVISAIKNHQNAMLGLHVAIDALEGARIHHGETAQGEETVLLEKRIKFSQHMYVDTIQAISCLEPNPHFHLVSIFLESMAYRFNPSASYNLEA